MLSGAVTVRGHCYLKLGVPKHEVLTSQKRPQKTVNDAVSKLSPNLPIIQGVLGIRDFISNEWKLDWQLNILMPIRPYRFERKAIKI